MSSSGERGTSATRRFAQQSHLEPPLIVELVAHEDEGPALHRPDRRLNGDPVQSRQLEALLRANLGTLLDVEPVRPLVVHDQPLAPQHGVQPRTAVAAVLRSEVLHPRDDGGVILCTGRYCCTDCASPTILRRSPGQSNSAQMDFPIDLTDAE